MKEILQKAIEDIAVAVGVKGRFLVDYGVDQVVAAVKDNRKSVLLKASFDMLKKCRDSNYALSPMETTVFYDDADCDGTCLLEDIAYELEIDERTGLPYHATTDTPP